MNGELVRFGDGESEVVAFLKAELTANGEGSVPVQTTRGTNDPGELVQVSRVGGTRTGLVQDRPIILVECWAGTIDRASELATLTRALMHGAYNDPVAGSWLSWSSEAAGPTYFPHPDTDAPRYQHTQEMSLLPQG